jgi:hypothetical protein
MKKKLLMQNHNYHISVNEAPKVPNIDYLQVFKLVPVLEWKPHVHASEKQGPISMAFH